MAEVGAPQENTASSASRFKPAFEHLLKTRPVNTGDRLVPFEDAVANAYNSFVPALRLHILQDDPLAPIGPNEMAEAMQHVTTAQRRQWLVEGYRMRDLASWVKDKPELWDTIDVAVVQIQSLIKDVYAKSNPKTDIEMSDEVLMALILSIRSNVQGYFFDADAYNDMKSVISNDPLARAVVKAFPELYPEAAIEALRDTPQ